MKTITITRQLDNFTREHWARISRPQAQCLWGTRDICICPCKLNPFGVFYNAPIFTQAFAETCYAKGVSFKQVVNEFEYYNCTAETGYYAVFYIRIGD